MDLSEKKIGFFDSGVGGLTVFKEMKKCLPFEKYLFLGDLKNSPYGEKSSEELILISKRNFDFFAKQGVKAVVMACNTSSAIAYEKLKNLYDFEIYPIIQPCSKIFSEMVQKRICVFATNATVNSHAYLNNIKKYNSNLDVLEIACPEWVGIVEGNKIHNKESLPYIKKYVDKALAFNPEKIILGCTHYPFLIDLISAFIPQEKIVNPANIFVKIIIDDMSKKSLLSTSEKPSEEFFVTAFPDNFRHAATNLYNIDKLPTEIVIK